MGDNYSVFEILITDSRTRAFHIVNYLFHMIKLVFHWSNNLRKLAKYTFPNSLPTSSKVHEFFPELITPRLPYMGIRLATLFGELCNARETSFFPHFKRPSLKTCFPNLHFLGQTITADLVVVVHVTSAQHLFSFLRKYYLFLFYQLEGFTYSWNLLCGCHHECL